MPDAESKTGLTETGVTLDKKARWLVAAAVMGAGFIRLPMERLTF